MLMRRRQVLDREGRLQMDDLFIHRSGWRFRQRRRRCGSTRRAPAPPAAGSAAQAGAFGVSGSRSGRSGMCEGLFSSSEAVRARRVFGLSSISETVSFTTLGAAGRRPPGAAARLLCGSVGAALLGAGALFDAWHRRLFSRLGLWSFVVWHQKDFGKGFSWPTARRPGARSPAWLRHEFQPLFRG